MGAKKTNPRGKKQSGKEEEDGGRKGDGSGNRVCGPPPEFGMAKSPRSLREIWRSIMGGEKLEKVKIRGAR